MEIEGYAEEERPLFAKKQTFSERYNFLQVSIHRAPLTTQDYIIAKSVKKPKLSKEHSMKLYEILETFDIKDALRFNFENKPRGLDKKAK